MQLSTPLRDALSTTEKHYAQLEKMGLLTVKDLLLHFPSRVENMASLSRLSDIQVDTKTTLTATLSDVQRQPTRTGRQLYKALVTLSSGETLEAVWFNAPPYNLRTLPEDRPVRLIGKVSYRYGTWQIAAPEIHTEENEHTESLRPLYPESGKIITSHWLRGKIPALLPLADALQDPVPEPIRRTLGLYSLPYSVRAMHRPASPSTWALARSSLGFAELFLLQLRVMKAKAERTTLSPSRYRFDFNVEAVQESLMRLPFALTHDQKRALHAILKDFASPEAARRLIQGDVGSGKTVVCFLAAEQMLQQGGQVALLAPTEILASQHYEKAVEHFSAIGVTVELLIGALSVSEKTRIRTGLANGQVRLVVGTHALLTEDTEFRSLGMACIDEQHRFGVRQRAVLEATGAHIISLSATPIPRSLALTVYGEQDLSTIRQLPPGRKPAITRLITSGTHYQKMLQFIEDQRLKGHQIFWVCPLINESESDTLADVRHVTGQYQRLQAELFPQARLGLLHGQMKSSEKEEVMRCFQRGETDILVSTSVIEVGVDISNATVMVIENSERFGLSQLHQFRGRIGRSSLQSYCFLLVGKTHQRDTPRLRYMEQSTDGFFLAEKDMELRGMGELYGTRQSGLPDFKCADITDTDTILQAQQYALEVLTADPTLAHHPALAHHVATHEVFF
ncbi:ATP-dependent DNA helicase RecG [Candidatus Peribacteria bacterium]|nr:ATP-dependent DNA helicase RecG [Candidatus Peribacteria bacterium]